MASKADKFYFQNFVEAADASCKAADYLVSCLINYRPGTMETMLKTMHDYEHAGDTKKHEMSAALAKAFVTPVDREDLALISQNIDEVTDRIEEVLQCFYINRIQHVTPEAIEFARRIADCCRQMKDVLSEFPNFKKPAKLHNMVVALNNTEEDCDQLYLNASHKIRDQVSDVLEIIAWRDIYKKMEDCADACEHVSDCIDTVVMKNT